MHPGESKKHLAKMRKTIEELEQKLDVENLKTYRKGYREGFAEGLKVGKETPAKSVDKP